MKAFTLLLFVCGSCSFCLRAQSVVVPTPQPWTFSRVEVGGNHSVPQNPSLPKIPVPSSHNMPLPEVNSHNQAVMQMIEEDIAYHEEMERQKLILEQLIYKGFPSWEGEPGTEDFFEAYEELSAMLADSIPLSVERAVFLVENAYLGNTMKYSDFQNKISERVQYCRWRLNDLKLSPNDGLAKNMAIFSLLTDTLSIRQPGSEKTIVHYPLKYNLDDYDGRKDYTSHFVSSMLEKSNRISRSLTYIS